VACPAWPPGHHHSPGVVQRQPPQTDPGSRLVAVDPLEIAFSTLLVLMSLVIVWFAGYVVYKLYKGQA